MSLLSVASSLQVSAQNDNWFISFVVSIEIVMWHGWSYNFAAMILSALVVVVLCRLA